MEYTKTEWKEMLNRRHDLELKKVDSRLSLGEIIELGTLEVDMDEGWCK